ncbi:serine protease, partial [Streptomyces niveus]
MTSESESSISGPRRVARVAAATGLAAALIATGALPVFAAPAADDPAASAPVKPADSASAKLGSADVDLLDKAVAEGDKNVTVMVATAPGQTGQVSDQFEAVSGAVVGKTYDKLGYVRATLPTGKAEAALKAATKLSSVHGIDLKHEIELDDPTPAADTVKGAAKAVGAQAATAPGANTPAKNPYNPSFETGAVDFVKQNPKADGRGVTIGILDSGIDLGHPALQKTT